MISRPVILALTLASVLPSCGATRERPSLEDRVSILVDQAAVSGKTAERAFFELEQLGAQAAPYLVGHLRDLRPLQVQQISLENKAADAFEGVRHYGPETVHDALAAILNQVTGQSFIAVYNGASLEERQENRKLWVAWCRSAYQELADKCGPGQ